MVLPTGAHHAAAELRTRREVVRLLGVAAATVPLGGCGVRLASAPPVTAPTATRVPAPDEAVLQAALARATRLAELATRTGHPQVAARHTTQAQVCRSILAAAGASATLPPSASFGSVPPTGSAPAVDPLAVAEAARDDLPWVVIAGASTHHRLAVSLAAHDSAVAGALGAPVPWPPGARPAQAVARAQLEPARAAAYALEVAVARVPVRERSPLIQALGEVRRRVQWLTEASGGGTGGPLSFTLPFPVESRVDADRLAREVFTGLVAAGLDGLEHPSISAAGLPPSPAEADAVAGAVALLAQAVALGAAWGVPATPFPGLRLPG